MKSDRFVQMLHDRKLKATSPRINLLQAIHDYDSAMPHAAIQQALAPIDRVTLYRTLESLMSKGLIHKAYQEGSDTFYAICDHHCSVAHHQHNHIHFKCKQCKTVTCETPVQKLDLDLPGYKIDDITISMEGICKRCSAA